MFLNGDFKRKHVFCLKKRICILLKFATSDFYKRRLCVAVLIVETSF